MFSSVTVTGRWEAPDTGVPKSGQVTFTLSSAITDQTANNVGSVTGIAVTGGSHSVQMIVATKNGSSSGFGARLGTLSFIRTA